MTRRWWLAAALLSSLGATGAAGAPARVSARVRAAATGRVAARRLDARGRVRVSVWRAGGARALREAGFAAEEGAGDLAYASVMPGELPSLLALPGVRSVELERTLHPLLDRSVPATGATALRHELGVDGGGAVVGVVDTGVDFRHGDLRAADGSTRVAALLDVTAPRAGHHPELPDYGGAVWLRGEIDAQLRADRDRETLLDAVTERDVNGHGTHVCGIAASNGLARPRDFPSRRYVGMAPAATLVVAQVSRDGERFAEGDVVRGARFVYDRAAALGMPGVVNLSLGGEGGPHDGTTNFERALSALAPGDAPGRALVVSVGNGGARDQHAGGWRLDGPVEVRIHVPAPAGAGTRFSIDVWTDAAPRPPRLTVITPDGRQLGPVARGDTLDRRDDAFGRVLVHDEAAPDPINHRHEATIDVVADGGREVAAGDWRLVLDGEVGRWDAWMSDVGPAATPPRFLDQLDDDDRGGYPAYAASALSVGSYVTRLSWITVGGQQVKRALVIGAASSFSSTGPTVDGRFVPDVAAPGEFIISALSSDTDPGSPSSSFYVPSAPGYLVAQDGLHALLRGTSQAAPHVTGAVALLFSLDPTLTPDRLRELLRASARVAPGAPGYTPRGGFGQLDVARAAALLQRSTTGAVDPAASSVGVSRDVCPPGCGVVRVSVVPRARDGAPVGPGHAVTVASDAGRWAGGVSDLGAGRYERALLPEGVVGTAATLSVSVDGLPLDAHPTVWFVERRDQIGARLGGGGCGVGAGGVAGRGRARHPAAGGLAVPLGAVGLALAVALVPLRRRRRARIAADTRATPPAREASDAGALATPDRRR